MTLSYTTAFVSAFLISAILTVVVARWFPRQRRYRVQDVHVIPLSRFGGVAVMVAFAAALLLHPDLRVTGDIWALLLGAGLVTLGGIVDDRVDLPPLLQFVVQVVGVGIFLGVSGIDVTVFNNPIGGVWEVAPFLGLVITAIWMMLALNSLNWLDGLDGLGSSILVVGFTAIAILSSFAAVNQPPLIIVSLVAAGAVGAFLVFNAPPALVLLGTGGIYGMAFVLGGLSIIAGGKMATAAIVLGIPILDGGWVLWQRLSAGAPLAAGDRRHLHHAFLRAGFSPHTIVLFYSGITALFAAVALLLTGPWRVAAGAVVAATFVVLVQRAQSLQLIR